MLSLTEAVEPQQIVNSSQPVRCKFFLSGQISPLQPFPRGDSEVGYLGVVPSVMEASVGIPGML